MNRTDSEQIVRHSKFRRRSSNIERIAQERLERFDTPVPRATTSSHEIIRPLTVRFTSGLVSTNKRNGISLKIEANRVVGEKITLSWFVESATKWSKYEHMRGEISILKGEKFATLEITDNVSDFLSQTAVQNTQRMSMSRKQSALEISEITQLVVRLHEITKGKAIIDPNLRRCHYALFDDSELRRLRLSQDRFKNDNEMAKLKSENQASLSLANELQRKLEIKSDDFESIETKLYEEKLSHQKIKEQLILSIQEKLNLHSKIVDWEGNHAIKTLKVQKEVMAGNRRFNGKIVKFDDLLGIIEDLTAERDQLKTKLDTFKKEAQFQNVKNEKISQVLNTLRTEELTSDIYEKLTGVLSSVTRPELEKSQPEKVLSVTSGQTKYPEETTTSEQNMSSHPNKETSDDLQSNDPDFEQQSSSKELEGKSDSDDDEVEILHQVDNLVMAYKKDLEAEQYENKTSITYNQAEPHQQTDQANGVKTTHNHHFQHANCDKPINKKVVIAVKCQTEFNSESKLCQTEETGLSVLGEIGFDHEHYHFHYEDGSIIATLKVSLN